MKSTYFVWVWLITAIVYSHQGVYVCVPDENKIEEKERYKTEIEFRKYKFDKETQLKREIEQNKVIYAR